MFDEAIVTFRQKKTVGGVLNMIELVHPALHGGSAGRKQIEFLHHGVERLPEPSVLDGYLFGVLLFCMGGASRLRIEGPVSVQAMRNVNALAEAWHTWVPARYTPLEIVPEKILTEDELLCSQRSLSGAGKAIAAFSGGVDSTFTVLRHASHSLGPAGFDLKDLVMVHGFDVNLANQADFDELLRRTDPLIRQLDANLHVVRTNIREQIAHDWNQVFGAQLACVLHQFSPQFRYGLLASGAELDMPDIRWGSTPQLDPLLSGGDMHIVHDGAAFSRNRKVAFVAKNPVARQSVKVCWIGQNQGRNCGVCEKCIRTRLNFLAAGYEHPECFDTPFDLDMIDNLTVANVVQLNLLKSIANESLFAEPEPEWVKRLQGRIEVLESQLCEVVQPETPDDQLETLSRSNEAQANEIERLNRLLTAIQTSTTWRATAPLRDFMTRIRRSRNRLQDTP